MRKLQDHDFLRNDELEPIYFSYLNRKLNQLANLSHIYAFLWKMLLVPFYVMYSTSKPMIKITNVDKALLKLRINKTISKFCIRTKILFIFD